MNLTTLRQVVADKRKSSRGENEVFAELKAAKRADEIAMLEVELIGLLRNHAEGVVFNMLGEKNPDVVQEAVSAGFGSCRTRFKGTSLLSTWFHALARNCVKMELRRRKYEHLETSLDAATELAGASDGSEAKAQLDNLKARLSDKERELLDWKLEKRTESEIAGLTGLSLAGVRSRWFDLKRKLAAG